ncbi:MAG: lysophospholipase [Caldicoprobacterales bacterium]|jgi:alpha-beta hydrolase superfamily lysophospholipase|nr:alpha/beta hydrolase [Clostridiales bacterium]
MSFESITIPNQEGSNLCLYKWSPKDNVKKIGVVQIAHGMAEWAGRYDNFAERLVDAGYIVYANDHRGHGKTAKNIDDIGFLGKDGFNGMVRDLKVVHDLIQKENPDLPVFLFGHSMGSFLAQSYASQYGDALKGIILSGSNGELGYILNVGIIIARLQVFLFGEKAKSRLLNRVTFGFYNKPFKPYRTPFDWLSRDTAEVDKYMDDAFCGSIFTSSFYYDFLKGLKALYEDSKINLIPKNLPVYILSGSMDPVGEFGKGVTRLAQQYRHYGLTDVTLKLYEDARHEILNEINKDEVINDILRWLDSKV